MIDLAVILYAVGWVNVAYFCSHHLKHLTACEFFYLLFFLPLLELLAYAITVAISLMIINEPMDFLKMVAAILGAGVVMILIFIALEWIDSKACPIIWRRK